MTHLHRGDLELADLIGCARSGDPNAWEAIYRRTYPQLFAYERRRLPSDTQAEDAVSDAMLRAIDGISRFDNRGAGIDGWLYGILRNVIAESRRSDRRIAAVPVADSAAPNADPATLAVADEFAELVQAAFAELSPRDQEILELRVIGGLTTVEIASIIGRNPGATRMAASRALQRLRCSIESSKS